MLGQRRIRLNGIEPAIGCDTGPTLNRYWVGRPLCVPGTCIQVRVYTGSAVVVEGIGLHVKDILVSWYLCLNTQKQVYKNTDKRRRSNDAFMLGRHRIECTNYSATQVDCMYWS